MVGVQVINEKGITHSEYKKNGKHRIYFKSTGSDGKAVEVGNYDLIEGSYFPARGSTGDSWGIVDESENPQALIVIGGERKVFVGPKRSSFGGSAPTRSYARAGNGGYSAPNKDREIKLGMSQNNAASIVAAFNPLEKGMNDDEIAEMVRNLRDAIFSACCE